MQRVLAVERSFLAELHCPYCGSELELELAIPPAADDVQHGVVRCACYRYPVLDGIVVLRQPDPARGDRFDAAVACLRRGQVDAALRAALASGHRELPRWLAALARYRLPFHRRLVERHAQRRIGEVLSNASMDFQVAVTRLRWEPYSHYLTHRFANPSFLAAIPLIGLFGELGPTSPRPARVLDVGCGAGHASHLIGELTPELSVVAADHDFVNLYLARRFIAPNARCLCIDVEMPLPFPDRWFAGVFCLDTFHYVRAKTALVGELDRVTDRDGLWLFPHLHNALVENISPGLPLAPEQYQRCFGFLEQRLLPEDEILRQLIGRQSLDLREPAPPAQLRGAQVLSLVAARDARMWRVHAGATERLVGRHAGLGFNPIYRVAPGRTEVELVFEWPHPKLARECGAAAGFLPPRLTVERGVWQRIQDQATTAGDGDVVRRLVESLVLVPLPSGYRRRRSAS